MANESSMTTRARRWRTVLMALLLSQAALAGAVENGALQVVDGETVRARAETARAGLAVALDGLTTEVVVPAAGQAEVVLLPMFSAQQGSWPFEPFVRNGLFRIISRHQHSHPRAVVIRGGPIGLARLHERLGNDRILERRQGVYVLRYPLIVESGAALLVEDSTLQLQGDAGVALINRGLLRIARARLEGVTGGQTARDGSGLAFRPFVVNWAGAALVIEESVIVRLGYNAHLSRGITTARSAQQATGSPAVRVRVRASTFQDMATGLELGAAVGRIADSRFENVRQYAVDAAGSRFEFTGNRIEQVSSLSGVRLSGNGQARLTRNDIVGAAKSGIEIDQFSGSALLADNRIADSGGYGILLRETRDATLVVERNLMIGSAHSAIDGGALGPTFLLDNRIVGTPEYGISVRSETLAAGPLVLHGNHLERVGKAMVRVEKLAEVVVGGNRYVGTPLLQNLLIGDLLPYQAVVLDATVRQCCTVAVRAAGIQNSAKDALAARWWKEPLCSTVSGALDGQPDATGAHP